MYWPYRWNEIFVMSAARLGIVAVVQIAGCMQ